VDSPLGKGYHGVRHEVVVYGGIGSRSKESGCRAGGWQREHLGMKEALHRERE
jgi:hypothetical protein